MDRFDEMAKEALPCEHKYYCFLGETPPKHDWECWANPTNPRHKHIVTVLRKVEAEAVERVKGLLQADHRVMKANRGANDGKTAGVFRAIFLIEEDEKRTATEIRGKS